MHTPMVYLRPMKEITTTIYWLKIRHLSSSSHKPAWWPMLAGSYRMNTCEIKINVNKEFPAQR